jgi:DNA-binding GntR family transcriptional regulator
MADSAMGKTSLPEQSLAMTAARFARMSVDPALRERRTTSDYIADALRAAIYDGQFADDEELNQVELAAYFKVSRVPIREALRQLQAEGLVRSVAHRRTAVIGLDLDEMLELIELRAVLEGYLVAKAGPRLDAAAIQRLNDLCDEADRIEDYGYAWVLKNWEFHRTLYQPSQSKAAIALVERLNLRVERYVRRSGGMDRLREAAAEHRRIVRDVERKNFAAARSHMQEHILQTGEQVRRYYAKLTPPSSGPRGAERAGSGAGAPPASRASARPARAASPKSAASRRS